MRGAVLIGALIYTVPKTPSLVFHGGPVNSFAIPILCTDTIFLRVVFWAPTTRDTLRKRPIAVRSDYLLRQRLRGSAWATAVGYCDCVGSQWSRLNLLPWIELARAQPKPSSPGFPSLNV